MKRKQASITSDSHFFVGDKIGAAQTSPPSHAVANSLQMFLCFGNWRGDDPLFCPPRLAMRLGKMENTMKRSAIVLAAAVLAPATAFGAALERSNQSVSFMFHPGNHVETSIGVMSPQLKGKALNAVKAKSGQIAYDFDTGSVANSFGQASAAVKYKFNDWLSLGVKYERPFGADVKYNDNDFGKGEVSPVGGMSAEAVADNITALAKLNITPNVSVFGGPAWQYQGSKVKVPFLGYVLDSPYTGAWGFVGGAGFEIPQYAMVGTVTYRSKTRYDHTVDETFTVGGKPVMKSTNLVFDLPQSVNVEFQTGVAKNTMVMAGARWVDWTEFELDPAFYHSATKNKLVSYADDEILLSLGVGHRFNDKLSGLVSVSHDSGAGEHGSPLSPVGKGWGANIGASFTPSKNLSLSLGVGGKLFEDIDVYSAGKKVA